MTKNWKLVVIVATSAVIGATAIAFASDFVSTQIAPVSTLGVMNVTQDVDNCPPNACSIVFKSDAEGASSAIVDVH